MKLEKKQALLMSNVLFLYLNDASSEFRIDLENLYEELNKFVLSTEVPAAVLDKSQEKTKKSKSASIDAIVSAIELHDLEFFSGLEFECDEDNEDVSLLVDGYAEHSGITAIERTSKSLQLHCGDTVHEHKIPKKSIPTSWKSLLPLNTKLKVEF